MKICTKCQIQKPLTEFYSQKTTSDGKKSWCKDCCRVQGRKHYFNDKFRHNRHKRKEIKEYQQKYRLINKNHISIYQKKYSIKNESKLKLYISTWKIKNKEKFFETKQKYYHATKDFYKSSKRERERLKIKSDPMFKLSKAISHGIRESLKHGKDGKHWEDIVGYSIKELRIHLELQFLPNMSWGNYGKWHIDHKIPISLFKYDSISNDEFKKCWSLENLQPLWAVDNLKKGVKIIY